MKTSAQTTFQLLKSYQPDDQTYHYMYYYIRYYAFNVHVKMDKRCFFFKSELNYILYPITNMCVNGGWCLLFFEFHVSLSMYRRSHVNILKDVFSQ